MNQLREKHIDVNNFTISYQEGGIGSSSAPILFLPGWGVSVETYRESLESREVRSDYL